MTVPAPTSSPRALLLSALLLSGASASACSDGGKDTTSEGSTGTSAADTSSSATSASADATSSTSTSGDPAIDCSVKPQVFPEFDKSCRGDDECIIVLHTDCCGPLALGLNAGEADAFAAAEAICGPQCPPLGCDHPTTAEDGKTAAQESDVQVECAAGLCQTFVP